MVLSLDTNVVIGQALGDENCMKTVIDYKVKEEEQEAFITPRVKGEARDLNAKTTQLLFQIDKKMESRDLDFNEALEDFKGDYDGMIDGPLESQFSNILDFLRERNPELDEFREIRSNLKEAVRHFHKESRRIRPPSSAVRPQDEKWEEVYGYMEQHNLAKGYDQKVLIQLWKAHALDSEEIEFVTDNTDDFKDSEEEWDTNFSGITVMNPDKWTI